MANGNAAARNSRQWDSIVFFIAGIFMLMNVIALWAIYYSDGNLHLLWAAVPGIIANLANVVGLFLLYPRISSKTPRLARSGAGFALIAGAAVSIAAIWLFGHVLFTGGFPVPTPNGVLALIAIFLLSLIVAFFCNAVAFLIDGSLRSIGYLLLVPVASWAAIVGVGAVKGMEVGLSLDFYTNALVSLALLFIAFILRKNPG